VADDIRSGLLVLLPRLRRFAMALAKSPADADDLVQAACERALRRADQLRDHTRVDAWIYGIIRNLWTDEVRGRRLRQHDDIDAAAEVIGEEGPALVEGRLGLAEVRQALSRLPEDQRTVLVLVCVDGLSYREAADVLGIPIGTVMSRISRGRLELHALLNNQNKAGTVTPFVPRRAVGTTRA
jgi:RNA polymerase sigma-70 factor (ECF subfamily)